MLNSEGLTPELQCQAISYTWPLNEMQLEIRFLGHTSCIPSAPRACGAAQIWKAPHHRKCSWRVLLMRLGLRGLWVGEGGPGGLER